MHLASLDHQDVAGTRFEFLAIDHSASATFLHAPRTALAAEYPGRTDRDLQQAGQGVLRPYRSRDAARIRSRRNLFDKGKASVQNFQ